MTVKRCERCNRPEDCGTEVCPDGGQHEFPEETNPEETNND